MRKAKNYYLRKFYRVFSLVLFQELLCSFMLFRCYTFFYPQHEINRKPSAEESVVVSENGKAIITADTLFLVETTDLRTGETSTEREYLSDKFMGMDREQFQSEIEVMRTSPSLAEKEKGLCDIELASFSSERVVLKKTYEQPEQEGYYLIVRNHLVSVVKADRDTCLQDTNIRLYQLPYQLQKQIMEGKYIDNQKMLYDFLETYTS